MVLCGLEKQIQCPANQENTTNTSRKVNSKETNGSSNEAKSRVSSRISVSLFTSFPLFFLMNFRGCCKENR
uniref:Uncharacterized protein n=1 Tax=Nelumbo nucifera TaxID=4432 RepID=A0A822ZLS3_NELNU|nr:TPA_asm: hypothetical protein HUJ06_002568 [Nelumbo nucifera]